MFETDPSLAVAPAPVDVSATGTARDQHRREGGRQHHLRGGCRPDPAWPRSWSGPAPPAGTPDWNSTGSGSAATCRLRSRPTAVSDRARDVVRGAVLRHARFSAFEGELLDDVSLADREGVRTAFDVTRDHERDVPKRADFSVASALPDDFVDRFAIVRESGPLRGTIRRAAGDRGRADRGDHSRAHHRSRRGERGHDLAQDVLPLVGQT